MGVRASLSALFRKSQAMNVLPDGLLVHVQHSGEHRFRVREMRGAVEHLMSTNEFWLALFAMVTTLIDGTTKQAYIRYLKCHFPALDAASTADAFYEQYRCGVVHNFSPKSGFGIGRACGMDGAYVALQHFPEGGAKLTVLNVDMFLADFLRHLDELER